MISSNTSNNEKKLKKFEGLKSFKSGVHAAIGGNWLSLTNFIGYS